MLGDEKASRIHFANTMKFEQWLSRWRQRLADEEISVEESALLMNQVNPKYIPRNHIVEEVIEAEPKNKWGWYGKGYAFDELGRKEEALEALRKALER